jgi:biotin carboxylase
MKKILIIGAGIEQVPAIVEAKNMGHHVIVTDMNMKAPGVKYADAAFEISTTDTEKNIKIARQENIDGVMTVCSETAVPTVAGVAETLGLPSFSMETATRATNKEKMREVLEYNHVKVAPYIISRSLEEAKNFITQTGKRWVIKPVDSSGQRGTTVFSDPKQLPEAFDKAISSSPAKAALLDEFIEGPEVHVTMITINGEVHFLALSDRITLTGNNFGIAVRHLGPSQLDTTTTEKIQGLCRKSVRAIGLENGVATCELVLRDGEPYVMEIAIRVPGGYLREVAMYLSGIDIVKSTIYHCLDKVRSFEELITEESFPAVSVKFISTPNLDPGLKKITSIENINKVVSRKEIKLCNFHFEGEFEIPQLKSSVGRFGAIVCVGDSREEVIEKTEDAFKTLRINGTELTEYDNYNPYNTLFNYNKDVQ